MKIYHHFTEARKALDEKDISLSEMLEYFLSRADQNKHLNAFLEVFAEEARLRANEIQLKIDNGSAGKLAGMIIAIKDNICLKGHKVSAASKILEGFESLYSSTAVQRLLNEDAIIIGRTNCDEFAMGSSNENSAFGPVLNPFDEKAVSGGSSGGSAVAVAANLCHVSLGSSTGGSVRQPASFTGLVGFKPTYGRVSRWGLIAFASSFDQISPFAHTIEDVSILMEVIAGPDEHDGTASQRPVESYSKILPSSPKRIAFPEECLESDGLSPDVKKRMYELIDKLRADGHEVKGFKFPMLDVLVPTYYVLTTAEASSNLARFDGIHYGFRDKDAQGVDSTYKKSRSQGFGPEVKRRIVLGTFVLSAGYYDAYYGNAQKTRRIVKNQMSELLSEFDLLLMPTTTDTAFKIGDKSNDPIEMYLQDIFTVLANLVGMPAVSLPLGKAANGMPFGIQFMANSFKEHELLSFSHSLLNTEPVLEY